MSKKTDDKAVAEGQGGVSLKVEKLGTTAEAIRNGFLHHLKYTLAKDEYSATDHDRYYALAASLPESVKADLWANNEYWARFETKAAKVSEKVYDTMLKSYGQELGVRSYGAVVDLLLAWYQAGMLDR